MMITLNSQALAGIVQGDFLKGSGKEVFFGVSIDSRETLKDSLFVALRGEKLDGTDFVEQAIRNGAKGALVFNERADSIKDKVKLEGEFFIIKVEDTLHALQSLARYYRGKARFKVVGITGSTGKTTTKDYVKSVLSQRFRVAASPKNFNNEIGLPLSLLNSSDSAEVMVLELAMRGLGEIAQLADIAQPEVGVVTSVGLAHYERLGSQDKIAQAKAELLQALPPQGFAIIPANNKYADYLEKSTPAKTLKFGFNNFEAPIRAEQIRVDEMARPRFRLVYGDEEIEVSLGQSGKHFVENALAAAAVGYVFGLGLKEVKEGLEKAHLSSMRGEIENFAGVWIINDAYNANPDSMNSALELLIDFKGERKIACLGDMLELGAVSEEQHRLLGQKIYSLPLELVLLVGKEVSWIKEELLRMGYKKEVEVFKSAEDAGLFLASKVKPGDAVLFKASRLIEMEKAIEKLKEKLKDA